MGGMSELHMQASRRGEGHVPHIDRRDPRDDYPYAPAQGKRATSAATARKIKPKHNEKQALVLSHLKSENLTNSEIFAREANLSAEELRRYYELRALERGIQPRAGELVKMGTVFDSGRTRVNAGGNPETVWTVRDPSKRPLNHDLLLDKEPSQRGLL